MTVASSQHGWQGQAAMGVCALYVVLKIDVDAAKAKASATSAAPAATRRF